MQLGARPIQAIDDLRVGRWCRDLERIQCEIQEVCRIGDEGDLLGLTGWNEARESARVVNTRIGPESRGKLVCCGEARPDDLQRVRRSIRVRRQIMQRRNRLTLRAAQMDRIEIEVQSG